MAWEKTIESHVASWASTFTRYWCISPIGYAVGNSTQDLQLKNGLDLPGAGKADTNRPQYNSTLRQTSSMSYGSPSNASVRQKGKILYLFPCLTAQAGQTGEQPRHKTPASLRTKMDGVVDGQERPFYKPVCDPSNHTSEVQVREQPFTNVDPQSTRYKAALTELKNTVLCSSMENKQLPINTLKSILDCGATVEYQCGRITQEQYFARLGADFGHSREEIETVILAVRNSLRVDEAVLESLVAMKARFEGRLKFYAVTNLSQEDYTLIKGLSIDWSLFEQVFVSSEMGMQKPELRFYQRILDEIGLQAEQVILVDDDTDNMLAALSMGLQGVLSLEGSHPRSILNLLEVDPIGRGTKFIQQNAQNYPSFTHTGVPVKENFEQLLILDLTGER
ncbi:MAG: hypothetical protein Q9225_003780 [Loekoesia sp. 1 TL-2023]